MMRSGTLFLACVTIAAASSAQFRLPADTSFTVYGAFVKAQKTNPGISIAKSAMSPRVKTARNIFYCPRGAYWLALDVFYPLHSGKKRLPGVLLIHGGGWRSGERVQQEPMAVALAAAGYVAVDATYRLSGEAIYPAALYDLKAAVRWMRANARTYKIDPEKIAVLGCSAGGQLAALLGTTNGDAHFEDRACSVGISSRVQAIVDVDGVLSFIHPESGEGDERKGPSAATRWFGGNKEELKERWQEASPLNHISNATPPMLFINSGVARMHAGREDAIHKLDSLSIYTEVHTFEDAPHPFWLFHPWFEPMMKYIIAFLGKVFAAGN